MRHRPIVLLALLVLASCSQESPPKGPATDDAVAAIAMPERQLRTFLVRMTLGTHSGPMFLYDLGLERGCAALGSAVDDAVTTHLPAWRQNLISAYRENVPAEELARAVQRSPRSAQRRLADHIESIGRSMQSKSTNLLNQAGTQVLDTLSKQAAQVDKSTIDQGVRQTELREAMRTKRICSELLRQAEKVNG